MVAKGTRLSWVELSHEIGPINRSVQTYLNKFWFELNEPTHTNTNTNTTKEPTDQLTKHLN